MLSAMDKIFHDAPVGVTVADATQPDMPLIYVNPAFESMTGFSAADVVGTNCRFLQAHDADQPATRALSRAIREERECRVRLRNYRKDGTLFWNELTIFPVKEYGQLLYYLGIQLDITPPLSVRTQSGASETQTPVGSSKQENMVAVLAHDLKNAMSGIMGIAEMLEKGEQYNIQGSEYQQFAKHIRSSSQRIVELIRYIVNIRTLTSDNPGLVIQPVNVHLVVQTLVDEYKVLAAKKMLHLQYNAQHDALTEPAEAFVDEILLREILDNLLSNAVKYSPPNTSVTVTTRISTLAVRIAVQDEGPGLTENDKAQLFTRYAKLSAQPTGGEESTGLGLYIVREMVESLNGKIWCESEFGKGATFIVEVPRNEVV
jgi:hypothetical protein